MQYISEEEFLKQSEKVRNNIIDWWQPEVGDLVYDKINIVGVIVPVLCIGDYKSNLDKSKIIPLLTEGKLRQYIEDKTKGRAFFLFSNNDGYTIKIDTFNGILKVDNLGFNIFKAYWKVVCEIAESESD